MYEMTLRVTQVHYCDESLDVTTKVNLQPFTIYNPVFLCSKVLQLYCSIILELLDGKKAT